ncbi:hypothetical protein H4582DRAFT_2061088 [Lactarius indigo]|nr:hypothetical protein H4582DRAFT_2061088 [Lactarius indigo]
MAPHTRKSKLLREVQVSDSVNTSLGHSGMRTNTNEVSVGGQDVNIQHASDPTPPQRKLTGKGKRTSTSLNNSPRIPAAVQPTPAKKARNVGPDRGRPMVFHLASESEAVGQSPSRGIAGMNEGGTCLAQPKPRFNPTPRDHDNYPTTEEGSDDEDDLADLPQGPPDKIHKAMAAESPSWLVPAVTDRCTTPASVRKTVSTETLSSDDDMSPRNIGSLVPMLPPALVSETPAPAGLHQEQGQATAATLSAWPAETDLVIPPGLTRFKLTQQSKLMRDVVQDAIEDLQSSLLFINAFPNGILIISFIRQALNIAAQRHCPAAVSIQRRLLHDDDYILKFAPILRARIPLFRSEVKERCNTIVLGEFTSMVPEDIIQAVEWQRSGYKYVYPKGPKAIRFLIIQAIRDLYFIGGNGSASLSTRFDQAFSRHTGDDGVTVHEVPIPMVALVSTALYASIHEWRTGVQQPTEFSANTYFGVYQAHVQTLQIIQNQRSNAYHKMMSSIYSLASEVGDIPLGSQITEIDLDLLE